MDSPHNLVERLVELFPDFADEWDGGEAFGYDDGSYTYHSVLLAFGPVSQGLLEAAETERIKRFCDLLNSAVERGGKVENAVSTCFLEFASAIGVRKLIEPYLSTDAKRELK